MALSVDSDGILQPLGVKVVGDSRYEILPGTREYTEPIPGRAGEFDFGCDFEPRILELHCAMEVLAQNRPAAIRTIASQLNPLSGAQSLTFADEPGKVYSVRYSGKLEIKNKYPTWFDFIIPFKMFDPYILGAVQKSLTGSGTATNDGNVAAPFTLTIQGAVTNPSVTVGGYTMIYNGTVALGSVLIIDTEKLTAMLDGVNALPNFNGVFPRLQPGDNAVTAAAGGTTVLNWLDRWI
jgi:phage-related protein